MGELIYGVDPEGEVKAEDVRDALVTCFYEAHCQDTGSEEGDGIGRQRCEDIVRKAFEDADGNFDVPTKKTIEGAMVKLAEFSKSFRDPSVIQRHATALMKLVAKIDQVS